MIALFEPLKSSLQFAYVPVVLLLNLGIAALSFSFLRRADPQIENIFRLRIKAIYLPLGNWPGIVVSASQSS
jgi:hypothetical protein